jgi:hypothetical protein
LLPIHICDTIELITRVSAKRPLADPERHGIQNMGVEEIGSAIAQLSATDLAELMDWLEDHHTQVWDKQIEEDLAAGRLDAVLAEVDKEHEAGLSQPL